MSRFKAVNILTLLLPRKDGHINEVRKLDVIPPDFKDLPWIHERTDRKYRGYLEAQDTVILLIEMAGHHQIYEITCKKDEVEEETTEPDILVVSFNGGNN